MTAAVAVGGFDHHVVRALGDPRIVQNRLIGVADVAGEDDLLFRASLGEPRLDAGAAEQMAHVREPDHDALLDLDLLAVGAGAQEL